MARLTVGLRVHVAEERPRRRGPLQTFLHRLASAIEEVAQFIERLSKP